MSHSPLKTTTALVASLSLLLPHPAIVTGAWAQDAELLCLDESKPPCPEGEPEEGSTLEERAEFKATEAEEAARLLADDAAEAEAAMQAVEDVAASEAEAEAAAEAEAEAQAEASAAAAEAEAQATEDAAAAEAEVAAQLEVEAQAAEAAAEAEAEAAAQAEAEAQATEDAAAAEAEAAAQAGAEEQAAEDAAAAEAEAAAQLEVEAQAAEDAAAAEAEAEAAAQAEAEAQAVEDAAAAEAEAAAEVEVETQAAVDAAAAEAEAEAAAQAEAEVQAAESAAAAEAEAEATPEATPEAEAEAEDQLTEEEAEEMAQEDPTVAEEGETPIAATQEATAQPVDVVEETLDAESVRTSEEDFETAVDGTTETPAQDSGLSTIEKALLLGLGAVAVGSLLRNGDRVVENTGDRVVVEGSRGLSIYKDDDALLRQPGANIRNETFSDGSTRNTLDRVDGSQVVTIRDVRGRVLRRVVIYPDGTRYELFDDLEPAPAVNVRQLQETRPAPRRLSVATSDRDALRAAIGEEMAYDAGRTFSLRQIREIEQVRSLVPAIDLDTVTFATGSAAIPAGQDRSLVMLGIVIEEQLFENPREVFLIEGHTDAVGSASYNLALSDRRAESVALALTEAFRIPPENLIVQGYGEAFLKVETQSAEESNRRATVRRITPLLRQIVAN
ncbi:OmpA family protein [Roseicitreum antarcticum]|uniref:OmpA family protein n=1 Tax=Roseicitreum antarcticum TaxID=564137 RepID=A0A1H3F7A5_9RHOB|nr:OmpA family protein [Roseicitreum antarcticum]SDX86866.1 OmpA family protein [Roseicitreum antarcticum]